MLALLVYLPALLIQQGSDDTPLGHRLHMSGSRCGGERSHAIECHRRSRRERGRPGLTPCGPRGDREAKRQPRYCAPVTVQVEVLGEIDDEVVTAIGRLLPQLSRSAKPLTAADIAALE